MSIRIPLDFHWLCLLEFHWSWSFLGVGLLLVHWKSIRKVCWTERSDQKCLDKCQKIIGKLLYSKGRKKSILGTQSPTESAQKSSGSIKTSTIGALEKGWSPNSHINLSVCHTYLVLSHSSISPEIIYIDSVANPADPILHGELGEAGKHLSHNFKLPEELIHCFIYV